MVLDSYEKAALYILAILKKDPGVLIINSENFLSTMTTGKSWSKTKFRDFQSLEITTPFPDIINDLEKNIPYASPKEFISSPYHSTRHFITELVMGYGDSWIPIASTDYQQTLNSSFRNEHTMSMWQRYVRATVSKDLPELTILSVDTNSNIREVAIARLKTFN